MADNENLKQAGIYLVVMGREDFLKALQDANKAEQQFTEASKQASQDFNRFTTGSMAGAVALGQAIYNMAMQGIKALEQIGKQAIMVRGRFDELVGVAHLLAQQQGYTSDQTDGLIKSIRGYGIEANIAANMVTEFTRYNLDLSKAMDLARTAQDAAVLSGSNSSETLQRLIWGITTYNSMVLKTAGIQVNTNKIMKEFAKENNASAEAMDANQRSAAMLNGVLEEGKKIAGAYTTAMESPYKLLSSYERVLNDLWVAMGAQFQPAFLNVVQTMTQFTKSLTAAIEGSGVLAQLFRDMGALATFLTGAVEDLSQKFSEDLFKGIGVAVESIQSFVANALDWGFNLIANFAQGIIDGAGSTLQAAMNYVAGIISWFLEAHSPPRALPNLPKWGQKAMESYLHGFMNADFSVLGQLSGVFSSALGAAVAMGRLGQEGAATAMYSLNQNLIKVMATGEGEAKFLSRLGSVFGGLGKELVDLTKKSLAYASALREIEKATKAFEEAQKDERSAIEKINRIMDDYNDMMRTGATEEEKAAKLAEFRAAQQEMKDARSRMDVAQQEAEAKSDSVDKLKDELQLQQQIVQQLVEMQRLQAQILAARQMAGGGRAGITIPETEQPPTNAPRPELGEGVIGTETMRVNPGNSWVAMLKQSLPALTPIIEVFRKQLDGLQSAWNNLSDALKPFYEKYLKPVIDAISNSGFAEDVVRIAGSLMGFAFATKGLIAVGTILVGLLNSFLTPLLLISVFLGLVKQAWDNNWGGMRDILLSVWENIKTTWDNFKLALDELTSKFTDNQAPVISFSDVLKVLGNVFGFIIGAIGWVIGLIAQLVIWIATITAKVLAWVVENIKIADWLNRVGGNIRDVAQKISQWLYPKVEAVKEAFSRFWEVGKQVLDFLLIPIQGVFEAIKTAIGWVVEKFGLLGDALSKLSLPSWLVPGSPTPLETGISGIATETGEWATSMQIVQEAFDSLSDVVRYFVDEAFVKLTDIWARVLLPTLTEFASFLSYKFQPGLKELSSYLMAEFIPASMETGETMELYIVSPFSRWLKNVVNLYVNLNNLQSFLRTIFFGVVGTAHTKVMGLANAFGAAAGAARSLAQAIDAVAAALEHLAEVKAGIAQPGSPSPLENSLWGIYRASKNVNGQLRTTTNVIRTMSRLSMPTYGAGRSAASYVNGGGDVAQTRAPISGAARAMGGDTNYNVEVQANYTNPQIPQTVSNDIFTALQLVRIG